MDDHPLHRVATVTCEICGKPSSLQPEEYRGSLPFRCREHRPGSVGYTGDGRRFTISDAGERVFD